jgi:hypothetical protein
VEFLANEGTVAAVELAFDRLDWNILCTLRNDLCLLDGVQRKAAQFVDRVAPRVQVPGV